MNKNFVKAYINSQPIKVVEWDDDLNKLKYIGINEWQKRTKADPEELVRAFLITRLVNELGYKPERIEIEREYDIGRPKVNRPRIDIIVRDNNGDAFMFIECKKPESYEEEMEDAIEKQLFNLAGSELSLGKKIKYLVYYTAAELSDRWVDKCMIIDYDKFNNYEGWAEDRQCTNALPARYGKAQKTPYIKGSENDLEKSFTNEMLNSLQKELHNVLWGGGSTDDNEIFSSLTNLILAKIQDEDEKEDGQIYSFQSLAFEKDGDEEFESNDELFDRINALYRRALKDKLNITDETELAKSFVVDTKKFSLSKLKYTVQRLEGLSFVDGKNSLSGKDILGVFFEGIIREGFKQSKGQFFTHINVVRFMLWALQADKLAIKRIKDDREIPYMIDPSAGSGTFLIEYMKFITHTMKYLNQNEEGTYNKDLGTSRAVRDKILSDWFYPHHRENRWAREFIYGSEINFNLGTATKVNMILHGDGSTNIFVKDGLAPFEKYEKSIAPNALNRYVTQNLYKEKDVNEQFDLILTNPPFSVELDNDTKKTIVRDFLFGDKKNSENLFIERWYQLLRENGRLAAVLPESVFDTTENKYIRLFIFKYFKVKAIVSLPQLTFEPYTSTKTSILFLQKKTKAEIENWNALWDNASNEYARLKTRVENLISVYDGTKRKEKLPSIKDMTEEDEVATIRQMAKAFLTDRDSGLTAKELIEKYHEELIDLCTIDKDTKDIFGFVNTWWVFGEVAKQLDYDIFMAEAENIGYKRTKRGEKPMNNDLYRSDATGIIVDDGKKESILDYMRDLQWD